MENFEVSPMRKEQIAVSKEWLKEDGISFATNIANSGIAANIPKSHKDDPTEVRLIEKAKAVVSERSHAYASTAEDLQKTRDLIEINDQAPVTELKCVENDLFEAHRAHSVRAKLLSQEIESTKVALTAESVRHKLTRNPILTTTSSIIALAVGFAFTEAVITALSFLGKVGEAGAASATGLALAIAANNIGGGGFILGSVVLPRCFSINSGTFAKYFFRLIAAMMLIWLVALNFMLGHFRSTAGDFKTAFSNMISNPFNVGDMTGLALTGFGLVLIAVWCLKFFTSQDVYLKFGRLGDRLAELNADFSQNNDDYADVLRMRADEGKALINEQVEDAIAGYRLAIETQAISEQLSVQFQEDQNQILATLQDVASYRRSAIRAVLSQHMAEPKYLDKPLDLNHLKRTPINLVDVNKQVDSIKMLKDSIILTAQKIIQQIEELVASAQSRALC